MKYSVKCLYMTSILFSLAGCYDADTRTQSEWPTSVEQVVKITVSKLSQDDKKLLKTSDKTDLIKFHRTLGAVIRNDFGLLQGNDKLREAACTIDVSVYYPVKVAQDTGSEHECHPDEASMAIIGKVWETLQKQ